MNILEWLDLQYRNLFMLPSKDGKRRLVKNWKTNKLQWTQGKSNKPTVAADFEVPNNIAKTIEEYPDKGLTVEIKASGVNSSQNTKPMTTVEDTQQQFLDLQTTKICSSLYQYSINGDEIAQKKSDLNKCMFKLSVKVEAIRDIQKESKKKFSTKKARSEYVEKRIVTLSRSLTKDYKSVADAITSLEKLYSEPPVIGNRANNNITFVNKDNLLSHTGLDYRPCRLKISDNDSSHQELGFVVICSDLDEQSSRGASITYVDNRLLEFNPHNSAIPVKKAKEFVQYLIDYYNCNHN